MATGNRAAGTGSDQSSPNSSLDISDLKGPTLTDAVLADPAEVNALTAEHRQYLLERHGTLDLDPIPAYGPGDPLNWPAWKKAFNIIIVAFSGLMATLVTGSTMPSYETISQATGVTIQTVSYLTSGQILMLGVGPVIWRPVANRFGFRPVFFSSILLGVIFNAVLTQCESFTALIVCSIFLSLFISPPAALGTAVVRQMFFTQDRAKYMGVWQLLTAVGVPLGPVIFGFVTVRVGYHWIFGALAIVNGFQLILYAVMGPETHFKRNGSEYAASSFKREYLGIQTSGSLSWKEFVEPLTLVTNWRITVFTIGYSSSFVFSNVLVSICIPELFIPMFHLNPQQLGLQFLSLVIGNLIGEQIGGWISDAWMQWKRNRSHKPVIPEFRLWIAYLGYLLTMAGVVMFLVLTADAKKGHWTIKPLIGAGFAGAGGQIMNTLMFTYGVDVYKGDSANIGVFVTFLRQLWGFISPFWLPAMFASLKLKGSAGLVGGLFVVASIAPTAVIHAVQSWRHRHLEHEVKA